MVVCRHAKSDASFVPIRKHSFGRRILQPEAIQTMGTKHVNFGLSSNKGLESCRNSTSTMTRGATRNERVNGETTSTITESSSVNGAFGVSREPIDKPKAASAGTLGDIMSRGNEDIVTSTAAGNITSTLVQRDGLLTVANKSGTLASRFGIEHPLDRMALTANGNLQRLVSSYYDAPVQVLVDHCCPLEEDRPVANGCGSRPQCKKWDRVVHLTVHNQTFCTAHSIITVFDPLCQELVESGAVGLGQLFRFLDILPEFDLHNAAPYPSEGGFWRKYTLKCAELSCDIHEDFRSGIWDLNPKR